MIRRAVIIVLVAFASISLSYAQSNPAMNRLEDRQQPTADPKPKAEAKEKMASLTGGGDEQEGKWVLVNGQNMANIANLAADGFPAEAFAKHLGHKVTVRGTGSSGGSS